MKKKFIALSTLFLLGGGTSLFLTGCQKDYDGQLEILRNQIKNGAVSLEQLEAKITLIQTQITTLEEALKQAETNQKNEIQKLIDQLNAVKAELTAKTSELQGQIDEAKTDIQTLKDRITAAEQEFNNKLLEISQRIDQVDSKLNMLDGRIAKLEEQLESIQGKQDAVDATIQGLQKEIEELKNRPQTPDMTDKVNQLQQAVEALQQISQDLGQKVINLDQLISQVREAAEKKDAQLEQLIQKSAQDIANVQIDLNNKILRVSNKVIDLSVSVKYLTGQVEALNLKYNALDGKVLKLQMAFNTEIEKIWKAIKETDSKEEIKNLQEKLTQLEKQQNEFAEEVKKGLEIVLSQQKVLGTRVEQLEASVTKYGDILKDFQDQLDTLQKDVAGLSQWKDAFEVSYTKTINEIKEQLKNLPDGGDTSALKEQLTKMQEELLAQSEKLDLALKNQDEFSRALIEFREEMNNRLLAIELNYKDVLRRMGVAESKINTLANFTVTLQQDLSKLNTNLGQLTEKVTQQETEIAELKDRLNKLEGQPTGFITKEEVQDMLRQYQDKVAETLQVVVDQLKEKPNKTEVEKMIKDANQQLQSQIDTMKGDIDKMKARISALEEKVAALLKRVQSMQLVPDYSNGSVKLSKILGANHSYQMTLKVKVDPENCIEEIAKNKQFITINSQPVIPVRAAQNLPVFTVTSVANLGNGFMEVTATANYAITNDTNDQDLPFQVSVVLSDKNNNRATGFAAVRFSASPVEDANSVYNFFKGNQEVETSQSPAVDAFQQPQELHCLASKQNFEGAQVTQITKSHSVLGELSATSPAGTTGYNVRYKLAVIYTPQNKIDPMMASYIGVNEIGEITMLQDLRPGAGTTTSLEGYKVVVELQAYKGNTLYGKSSYACVELVME